MAQNHKFIDIVHQLGEKGYPLVDVYRRIQDRELFLAAYGKLYANQGATTQGTDPNDTVEGMSVARIDTIIEKLHNGNYVWKPAKRVYIPKSNGSMRPLGIPSWSDKLLQEVIRMVLEAYYEPQFSDYSHGFRPNRGCHTALIQIRQSWKGTKWFIEGDIKGCFDNISHQVLLSILSRNIKDKRLLKLIRQMLKAGYLEDWKYHQTYSGTPQGGVVSPILANIVLNELDNFVSTKLLPKYNVGKRKAANPEYRRISKDIAKARREGNEDEVKRLMLKRREIPSKVHNDPNYRRLRYNRYADDFILGFDGPRHEACEIKEEIKVFSSTISLSLSEEKTLITHATTKAARYLGYEIRIARDNNMLTDGKRRLNMYPQLKVPADVANEWRKKYTKNGKPTARYELLQCSDIEIVMTYGLELQGVVNYYRLAYNVSNAFYPVKSVFIQSAAMTIAAKHQKKVSWVIKKYLRKSEYGLTALIVKEQNPNNPEKPYMAKLGDKPIRTNLNVEITDQIKQFYSGRNELVRRLLANECELCGSCDRIRVHHVRKLADVKKRSDESKNPPPWAKYIIGTQ